MRFSNQKRKAMSKTLGQVAHEARGNWGTFAEPKAWEDLHQWQREELQRMADAVVEHERERLRGFFREALSDRGVIWPAEVDMLYDRCFAEPYSPDESE